MLAVRRKPKLGTWSIGFGGVCQIQTIFKNSSHNRVSWLSCRSLQRGIARRSRTVTLETTQKRSFLKQIPALPKINGLTVAKTLFKTLEALQRFCYNY